VAEDAREIVFAHDGGATFGDLWTASRASATDPWSNLGAMAVVNSSTADASPWLSADGLRLILASSRTGTGTGLDLMETTRLDRQSAFEVPHFLAELNSGDDDECPTLSRDSLELFFTSRRTGGVGLDDIYRAVRASVDQPFEPPQLVPELSTAFDEFGLRLSLDGATMYFNFDTLTSGTRNADVWIATRSCE